MAQKKREMEKAKEQQVDKENQRERDERRNSHGGEREWNGSSDGMQGRGIAKSEEELARKLEKERSRAERERERTTRGWSARRGASEARSEESSSGRWELDAGAERDKERVRSRKERGDVNRVELSKRAGDVRMDVRAVEGEERDIDVNENISSYYQVAKAYVYVLCIAV